MNNDRGLTKKSTITHHYFFLSSISGTTIWKNTICPTLKPYSTYSFTARTPCLSLHYRRKYGLVSSIGECGERNYRNDFNGQIKRTDCFSAWALASDFRPTLTHCFFSLLGKKGILQRIYVSMEWLARFPHSENPMSSISPRRVCHFMMSRHKT